MSGIGLAGAHRVGKTTLAKAFADSFDIAYIPSVTSDIIRSHGIDAADDCDFWLRMKIQWEILAVHEAAYQEAKGMFIADRTPLDFIAYALADVTRDNIAPEQSVELMNYKSACVHTINRYFNVLTVIQPGVKFVDEPGKPKHIEAYVNHINAIICGLASSEKSIMVLTTYMPKNLIDLNSRVSAVESSVRMAFDRFEKSAIKKGAIDISKSIH
ncbi:MAG: AAA family ATPase [Methylomicrobium sp.]|nr:AAA family ATPase [Methylomicrobium sp.]